MSSAILRQRNMSAGCATRYRNWAMRLRVASALILSELRVENDRSEVQMSAAKKSSPAEGVMEFIGFVVFLVIVIGAIATACS